jgi:hypothetical protein
MAINWSFLYRKKTVDVSEENNGEPKLARVLTVVDLTALGII